MTSTKCLSWLLLSASLLAAPAFAETGPARLVADLSPGMVATPRGVSGFTSLGNRTVFVRGEQEAGLALWITDGTVEGTNILGVLCPPCQSAVPLGSTGSIAFYRVDALYPAWETAVWRTDGTPAGTFPLMDDLPMTFAGTPGPLPAAVTQGGLLFFTACTFERGCELWSSDGTRAGTALFAEILPGPENAVIERIAASGDRAFLIVNVPGEPSSLWIADPATRSLQRLRTVPEASNLVASAGRAFFVAKANGEEVWASDGTAAGTRPVTSFSPPDAIGLLGDPPSLILLGGRAFFAADDGKNGYEIWSVGLRPETLRRVSSFKGRQSGISDLGKAGDRIVFVDGYARKPRLWSSKGDFRSAAPVAGCPGGCPSPVGPLASVGPDRLVFYGRDQVGAGLWVTDGTGPGTRLLQRTGAFRSLSQTVSLGALALIQVTEEYETGQLWVTDGTPAGTSLVTQGGPHWSHYYGWTGRLQAGIANARLIFAGITAEENYEEMLWRSDGSRAGSWPILDSKIGRSTPFLKPTPFRDGVLVQHCTFDGVSVSQSEMRFVQGTETTLLLEETSEYCAFSVPVAMEDVAVFVKAENQISDLWRTDGTPEGTEVLIPGSIGSIPAGIARIGDEIAIWFFIALPGSFRSELWLTDGTPEGTRKSLDLPNGTEMLGLTAAGGRLWFFDAVLVGETWGVRPWVSDLTPAGTRPLTETIGDALDQRFVEAGGRLYFLFSSHGGPLEIWGTDGTVAGTGPAVTSASGALEPQKLTEAGGRLYFAARLADDPGGLPSLRPWVSDGTDDGTRLLAYVRLGEPTFAPLDPTPFVELNGRVWFAASDGRRGDELWSTDGTPGNTAQMCDIAPDLLGSHPRGLTVWNGRLWFRARDAVHGMELWSTDGTWGGACQLVHDIAPGASWSSPGAVIHELPVDLVGTETGLYFPANDGAHGRELWVLP